MAASLNGGREGRDDNDFLPEAASYRHAAGEVMLGAGVDDGLADVTSTRQRRLTTLSKWRQA